MAKKKRSIIDDYYDISQTNGVEGEAIKNNTKAADNLAAYQKVAAEQTQPIETQQQDVARQTSANTPSNRPQSWSGLKTFLSENIDSAKDWDAENISDYSVLNNAIAAKKLTNDQRAEGQILFQNYLSDIQAQSAYNQALALAENQARKDTANNNAMADRIASYLREVQGNAGFEGYDGVTKGQAISLANMQAAAQQDVQNTRATAQQQALQAYQQASLENSRNFSDQYGTLMAARDEKADTNYQNYLAEVQSYIQTTLNDEGKLSKSDFQKAKDYISGLDTTDSVKTRLNDYIDLAYDKSLISDEESAAKQKQAKLDEINALTIKNFDSYLAGLTEAQKAEYKDAIEKKENEFYPKGRGYNDVSASSYKGGKYTFTYNGREYTVSETIGDDPLGSDTGTFTQSEASKWNLPDPAGYSYKDILRVEKGGKNYFYVKRNGKWYYLCNDGWSMGATRSNK